MPTTRHPSDTLVLVKGGGDLGTGVAHLLFRSGFPVIVAEIEQPTMVRRTVCFAECLYAGRFMVDGVPAERAVGKSPKERLSSARTLIDKRVVPVGVDPETEILRAAHPVALVDAIMSKRNTGTNMDQAEVVIALGPGFCAGEDVHAVIETLRGHYNGRVILEGSAAADTGLPGPINGYVTERMLYAPVAGRIESPLPIGTMVKEGQVIARVDGQEVRTLIPGVLRGIMHEGLEVSEGFRIGDVDPRGVREMCFTIADKSHAIGCGVLEAIMMFLFARP
jgi:xanthine dehydrogenase accessory factor